MCLKSSHLQSGCSHEIRQNLKPHALIIETVRFGPHSKGDDTRPPEVVSRLRQERDPLAIHARRLDPVARARIEVEVQAEIGSAFQVALESPTPNPILDETGALGPGLFD